MVNGKKSYRKPKGSKAKKTVKKVITRELVKRGLNKPEIKHNVYSASGDINSILSTAGTILDPTQQGNNSYILNTNIYPTNSQGGCVLGNKISARGVHLKWRFFNDTDNVHMCRMLVVVDFDPTNATTLSLYNSSSLGTNGNVFLTNDISSVLAPTSNRRFKVLYDKQFILSGDNDNKGMLCGSKYIKLHNARVVYTLDDINTDVLVPNNRRYYLFLVGDDTTSIAHSITADFTFVDV